MRILVLGASGMAGHTIAIYFKEKGHQVVSYSRRKVKFCDSIAADVKNTVLLTEFLRRENFDIVINCVGLLNQYADENQADAVFINSYIPHFLVKVFRDSSTKVIQMSTDCVFSGLSGHYKEDSLRDGISFYDRTKALGEIEDDKNLTFRNSIIGPDINPDGIGLFNWFMKQKGEIYGYTKAIWTGVTTLTLAKAMEAAINQNLCGIYNLVNNQVISKYELLCLFNKHFKQDEVKIKKNDIVTLDKSLVNRRADFNFFVPSYEQMIEEMKNWIINHRYIYPHYFK